VAAGVAFFAFGTIKIFLGLGNKQMNKIATSSLAAAVAVMLSGQAWASSSITRASSFAYDAASGLLTQEVIEPDTPALRLQTDYVYDAFGHKTSVMVSGVDITTRSSTTTYDAKGQFITGNSNALGQGESWQYDPRFGTPTSHTGPNGLTTTWSYDSFGRKITEVRADGTQTQWAYLFCSGVNGGTASCPTGASYLTQATPLAADGKTPNGPVGIVYFDSLDREVARDTQGFDGSTIRGSRQYDALGRLSQTSRPYFVTGVTPQFTTFTYDALGRVLTATTPDGGVSQTAYHGLSVAETNALNQTRTVVKNSQGHVVSVTDAAGQTMLYAYDAFGNLIQTTDALTNIVTATYDVRGRKISSSDPDLGSWTYSYNTLGQLVSQTDAKSQTSTLSYDLLGRPLQRVEPDLTSNWVYDTAANGIGKLASASITAGPTSGYQRSLGYDALGRPTQVSTTVGGTTYAMSAAYDANSRLTQVTYPSGFAANFDYNNLGYANQLSDGGAQTFWTLNSMDAEQHVTLQTSGNGVATTRGFSATTGRLLSVAAGASNAVQNLSFSYDLLGNPTNRTDNTSNLSESFTYDPLNRLLSATVSSNVAPVKNISYNAIGNILSKSDLGTYAYAAPGAPLPHAVTSISGSTLSTTFTYDPNGNQLTGLGRNISWTSFNMPASITQGTNTISFQYDVDHQRVIQIAPDGTTTVYLNAFGVSTELFAANTNAARWTDYLSIGNAKVGMRITNIAAATVSTRYFHTDHLGSVSVITDENGAVVERLSYDAWGKRRFPDGTDDPSGSITSQTTRGFTGEEELSVSGLLHLNGRVYDPLLARFTSADPTVTDPLNPQGWNRYSYVGNDPLAFTDPSGFNFFSSFFRAMSNFFSSIFNFFRENFRAILQIAVTAALNAILPFSGVLLAVASAAASPAELR
jgi:RHS repeat-associated protein